MDTINEEYSDGAALGRACKSHQLATIGNDFGALVCYVALLVSTPQWGRTALARDMRPQNRLAWRSILMGPLLRTLLVDDYEPWLRVFRLALSIDERIQIVGEAADGPGAVQKSLELRPDLVILDIGLPAMNGIEVARRLLEISPNAKVIFMTEHRSSEIVEEALRVGASGYVLKSEASRELLPALRAVLEGKQFVSSGLIGRHTGMPNSSKRGIDISGMMVENTVPQRHEAIFYSDDRVLLDRVNLFTGSALKSGRAAIVIATESHRQAVLSRLQGYGIDIPGVIEQGRYLAFDAEEALTTFMLSGVLDPHRLLSLFRSLITAALGATREQHSGVAIFGECVHLLWAGGNSEAAIQMERLATQLTRMYDVEILCGYSLAHGKMHPEIHQLICEQHSIVQIENKDL